MKGQPTALFTQNTCYTHSCLLMPLGLLGWTPELHCLAKDPGSSPQKSKLSLSPGWEDFSTSDGTQDSDNYLY